MRVRHRNFAALAVAAIALGCGDELNAPSQSKGIRLEAAVSANILRPGESGAITMRLRNLQPYGVTITFSSTCQLLTYVRGIDNGFEFPTPPGGYGCGDMITTISLDAFGEHSLLFLVHGQSNLRTEAVDAVTPRILLPGIPLPVGRYSARVELGHNYGGLQLISVPVSFEVRP